MVIMRSEDFWTMAKENCKKVKRPRVDWCAKIRLIKDKEIRDGVWQYYYMLMAKHPDMSHNRLAYNSLRHYYSSRTLDAVRWLGWSLD